MKPIYFSALFALILAALANTCMADSMLRVICEGDDTGAEVLVNGEFKGECPVDVQVPEGVLKLRVQKTADAEHEPRLFEQEIRMGKGVVKKVEAHLGAAQLNAEGKRQMADLNCPGCPEMVVIPAGRFQMGSPAGETGRDNDEGPLHEVWIGRFAMGKYEVTVGEFREFVGATGYKTDAENNTGNVQGCFVMNKSSWKFDWRAGRYWDNPDFPQNDRQPVVCVSWNDAHAYAEWMSRKTGKPYRLSSEAEWEYAARAGTTTARYWGDDPNQACRYANGADKTGYNGDHWNNKHECNDGYFFTAPVGSYQPNAFGLYDMLGNAWEWTEDNYHDNYNGAPTDGKAWAGVDGMRVVRGGSWHLNPRFVRAAKRDGPVTAYRCNYVGFRLARTLP